MGIIGNLVLQLFLFFVTAGNNWKIIHTKINVYYIGMNIQIINKNLKETEDFCKAALAFDVFQRGESESKNIFISSHIFILKVNFLRPKVKILSLFSSRRKLHQKQGG